MVVDAGGGKTLILPGAHRGGYPMAAADADATPRSTVEWSGRRRRTPGNTHFLNRQRLPTAETPRRKSRDRRWLRLKTATGQHFIFVWVAKHAAADIIQNLVWHAA